MAHHLLGAPLVTEKNIVSIFFWKIYGQIWSNCGQTNYSRILVLLNNYFSYFEFWSNLDKLWSNNGQTNYSRILVLLNNYFSYFEFWSNLVKLWSNNGQTNY